MRLVKVEDPQEIEIISQNHERKSTARTPSSRHTAPATAPYSPHTTRHAPHAPPRATHHATHTHPHQMLDRDLEDSEEQYQMALRSHLLVVDRLIDLHNAKIRRAPPPPASPPCPATRSTRCPLCPRCRTFHPAPPRTPAHAPSAPPRRGTEFEFERDLQELVEEFGARARRSWRGTPSTRRRCSTSWR